MVKTILKENNIKATPQRIAILELLSQEELPIKEITEYLPEIDASTVYRTLNMLVEKNIIDKNIESNKVVYSLKEHHKHYLKCIKCNTKIETDICPFENIKKHGYEVVNDDLTIDIICNNCKNK